MEFFLSSSTVSILHCSMGSGLPLPPFLTEDTIRSLFCSPLSSKDSWSLSLGSIPCPLLILLKLIPRFKSSWERYRLCMCMWAWQSMNVISSGNWLRAASFEWGIFFHCPSDMVTTSPSLDTWLIVTQPPSWARAPGQVISQILVKEG